MLYMNETTRKNESLQEQDDLFSFSDLTVNDPGTDLPAEPENIPEEDLREDDAAPAVSPETLPLIPEKHPASSAAKPRQEKPKKAPLIFSAHAPIPTRGGDQDPEEKDLRRKRILEQTAKVVPPLTMELLPAGVSLGELLKLARENASFTVESAADITHISGNYIQALERENFSMLPLFVYQTAYIRELCKLYKLPPDVCEYAKNLHQKFHESGTIHAASHIPPNGITQPPPEEEKRTIRLFNAALIGIGLLVLLGIWAIIAALVRHNGEVEVVRQQDRELPAAVQPTAPPVNFDQKKLEGLTPDRMMNLRTLEMSDTPSIRR